MFPGYDTTSDGAASLRKPLESLVEETCPTKKILKRKLTAMEFQSTSEDHLRLVKDMGITIITLPDGRVQLLHTLASAKTPEDGEEGLLFMQEMIDLSKQQTSLPTTQAKLVRYRRVTAAAAGGQEAWQEITAGPAQFGRELVQGFSVKG